VLKDVKILSLMEISAMLFFIISKLYSVFYLMIKQDDSLLNAVNE